MYDVSILSIATSTSFHLNPRRDYKPLAAPSSSASIILECLDRIAALRNPQPSSTFCAFRPVRLSIQAIVNVNMMPSNTTSAIYFASATICIDPLSSAQIEGRIYDLRLFNCFVDDDPTGETLGQIKSHHWRRCNSEALVVTDEQHGNSRRLESDRDMAVDKARSRTSRRRRIGLRMELNMILR